MRKRFLWILIGFALSLSITARLLLSWGVVYGARHHQYILDEAYKKLAADPAFPGSKFPRLSEIQAHEGVNVIASSAINPLGDKTGMFTGPGPDSAGNSKFTQHYFNPSTGKGGGPRTIAEHYLGLKSALESRNRVFSGLTSGGNIGHTAAYFAHFMADMNAPYHILGMPAEEAVALIKSGKVMIGEEIAGPTGKGPEDWIKAAGYWYEVYKADKTADWFDPWYWNGLWPATISTSTHVKWEGVQGTTTAAGALAGYATTFLVAQLSAGNGNQAAFESFAQSEAAYTGSLLQEAWLSISASGINVLLDHSIQNVYTVWRATFSALRPDFEVKQDPAAAGDKLIVKIKNVEDDDPAKDVVVSVKVKGGELKGPVSHTVGRIPASREVVIDGVWTIEKGTDKTEILIEVNGRFDKTPDSGSAVFERHLQLKKPEKPPAEKLKPDTKEKPTTTVPKKPGEKPPVVTPPPGIPTGGESPSSGTAAGGYWKLDHVNDYIDRGYLGSDTPHPHQGATVRISGSTITSRRDIIPGEYARFAPYTIQTVFTWTELPKSIAPLALVSTTLRLERSGGDPSKEKSGGSMFEYISKFAVSLPLPYDVKEGQTKTATWSLGKPEQPGQWGAYIHVCFGSPAGDAVRIYHYLWTEGPMPAAPSVLLGVNVLIDKPTVVPGETALLKATATGGTAPYTYAWAGAASGAADQLSFTAGKTGTQAFTVTVTDSKGATATASATITTEGPTVTLQRTSSGTVVLGLPYGFQAQLSAAGKPLPGAFVYRWEPHPEVTYTPHEGAGMQTTAVFTRLGRTRVWVDVLRQEGPVLVTVAESEQIEIDVVSPELSLAANPSTPYTGQEVRINVAMNPAIQDKYVTFWWEIQGNALNAAPVVVGDAYSRAYAYKPKDTAPVTVTVHSKSKDGGDDLGQKSIAVTAKLYQVKIGEPRLMGPPPRVWSEQAKRLVEVPRGIGTFQEFFVNASISPPPPDSPLRYEWKSQPEGCAIYSPGSQETRSSASQAGTFNISVMVRDSQNIVLGSDVRDVSIVEPTPEPKKTEPIKPPSKAAEAMAKLKEASALAADGKLDEAIAAADEASTMDPNSRPISSYTQQLKATKAQLLQHLDNVRSLGQKGSFEDASAELAKAKELVPNSPLVAAAEAQLKTLKQQNQAAGPAQTAQKLRAEGKTLEDAGQLREAAAMYRESLKYAPDPSLEAYIKQLEYTAKKNESAARQEQQQAGQIQAAPPKPKTEAANQQTAIQAATEHLNRALELGKAGQLDEAAAEVAEAKRVGPSHSKIPEFEKWVNGLIQQRNAANAAAAAKKAEAANQEAAKQEADREQAKKDAAKTQEAKKEAEASLAGTSWQGEISIAVPEGERWTWPLAITIQNDNSISGQVTMVIPGEPESQKTECQGSYDPGNGNFNLKFSASEEGVNIRGKLGGTAKSSNSAEGTITMNFSGFGEAEIKGTWRISRK